jgi:hypothetical protein
MRNEWYRRLVMYSRGDDGKSEDVWAMEKRQQADTRMLCVAIDINRCINFSSAPVQAGTLNRDS